MELLLWNLVCCHLVVATVYLMSVFFSFLLVLLGLFINLGLKGNEILPFSLISEELKDYLLGDRAINKIFTLGNSEFPVSWENEIKLWTFLENRASLLLKTYKTTSEVSQQELGSQSQLHPASDYEPLQRQRD